MFEARRLEQQGEFVEAIWCYETILRDTLITQHLPTLRAASMGLGLLLINETRASEDPRRTDRLISRAISVLNFGMTHNAGDAALALALAEAHGLRFALNGQAQDILAANMLLDTMLDQPKSVDPDILEHARRLRAHLAGDRTIEP